ncbi:MAG: PIN domain-containing protein [Nitrospira sp.]
MRRPLIKFVWDTSAIINIKEPDSHGYSAGNSLMKDLFDGWIKGPYLNIFPSIAMFEVSATIARKRREGKNILKDFYLFDENSVVYPIDEALVRKSVNLFARPGFNQLRGADLVFACIAFLEKAYLITLDKGVIKHMSGHLEVIDLNNSIDSANYRKLFADRMPKIV